MYISGLIHNTQHAIFGLMLSKADVSFVIRVIGKG